MKHDPIGAPPTQPTNTKAPAPTPSPYVGLADTILAQNRIIGHEIENVLRGRLEFEILLAAYVAEHHGSASCLSDICNATSSPSSTAHHKISDMIDRGLLHRLPPSGDRRRVTVQLSTDAKRFVDRTLEYVVKRLI